MWCEEVWEGEFRGDGGVVVDMWEEDVREM